MTTEHSKKRKTGETKRGF